MMPANKIGIFIIVSASAAIHAAACGGQVPHLAPRNPLADSSPARIMSLASKRFPYGAVGEVLRQRHQTYPLSKRRELADRVVAFAIGVPGEAITAVSAIAASGSADPGWGGTPDPDALERLVRIQREAKSVGTRQAALTEMIGQINPSRALPYLQEVAVSNGDDASAYLAVSEISRLAFGSYPLGTQVERAQAEQLLRKMFDHDLVKSGPAGVYLCEVAAGHKWQTGNRCRGIG